jgi:uncharacterized membrane protein YdjX (TVP38/TMEM64 family)/rhodanese-related sulfurtransferase
MNRRSLIYRLVLMATLLGAIVFVTLHRDLFEAARLQHELRQVGPWAPMLFIILYALATVLFVPGSAFSLAGGAIFGPLWGTIWNLTGATIGASLAFLAARYLASDWVAKKSGNRFGRVMRGVDAEGCRFVAFVRLVPLFPFNLLNYALGLTRIRFGIYIVTSAICMVPGAFAYTWLGYASRQAMTGGEDLLRDVLIAIGVLAGVALLPRLVRRFRAEPSFIESAELRRRLEGTPEIVVIDVRTPEEFVGPLGHICGARNIPVSELCQSVQANHEMRNTAIVLVCKSDKRSVRGAALLRDAGFEHVSVLRGGMGDWKRNGYPVESHGAAPG